MKFLLDTDHISILQKQSGPEFAALIARIAQVQRADLAFSIVSFHEQVLGCNSYIAKAKRSTEIVRGYQMFDRVLSAFTVSVVLPFDKGASVVFDSIAGVATANRDDGSPDSIDRVDSGIDAIDTQLARFQQSSGPSYRRLDVLFIPDAMSCH